MLIAIIAVVVVVLPLTALMTQNQTAILIGKIILTIDLIVAIVGTGVFGYICIRAQARKWGAGLVLIAVLAAIAIYVLWAGHLPGL
jgi:hypothetical protein